MMQSAANQGLESSKQGHDHPWHATFWEHLIFWPIVTAGVAADLYSKAAVFAWLETTPAGQFQIIDGFLRLVMVENEGAAFGLAHGRRGFLSAVSIVALFIVVLLFVFGRVRERLVQIALALFTAGIIGNLYDRLFNDGRVRDFIDVYWRQWHWPAFNVGDSMLCIAVGLIMIAAFTAPSSRRPAREQK